MPTPQARTPRPSGAAKPRTNLPGPLTDVRVLDLTDELGAYCAKLLADLGADVIKVEPPGGAPGRFRAPFAHDQEGPETSLWWFFYNTNKRSITLDVRKAEGQALLKRLAEKAEVIIEDSVPGTMEALGLGYSVLSTQSPPLIYTSITPFGQDGPHARYKASDLTGQAMGGFMYRIGWPEDPPNSMGANPAYSQAGAHGALGTLMALYHRDLTGQGQHVDVSMQETMAIINYDGTPRWSLEKKAVKRAGPGQGSGGQKATRVWPCKDGQVRFQLVQSQAYAEWPRVVKWLEDYGVAEDLGSEDWAEPFHRMANLEHPEEVIKRFFMTRTARELQEEGQSRRIMVMAFNKVDGLFTDPQLVDEGFFQQVEHPALGETITYPGAPYRFSKTPWTIRNPAPSLGQDNQEIYEGELGLSLTQLKATGVI